MAIIVVNIASVKSVFVTIKILVAVCISMDHLNQSKFLPELESAHFSTTCIYYKACFQC